MNTNPMNTPLPAQAKAVLAGVIAALGALLPALADGFTYPDVIVAVLAGLIAYAAVFSTPNADNTRAAAPVGTRRVDPDEFGGHPQP